MKLLTKLSAALCKSEEGSINVFAMMFIGNIIFILFLRIHMQETLRRT